jgi:hypothetical protein
MWPSASKVLGAGQCGTHPARLVCCPQISRHVCCTTAQAAAETLIGDIAFTMNTVEIEGTGRSFDLIIPDAGMFLLMICHICYNACHVHVMGVIYWTHTRTTIFAFLPLCLLPQMPSWRCIFPRAKMTEIRIGPISGPHRLPWHNSCS